VTMPKILYVDMDNVLVDFQSGIDRLDQKTVHEFDGRLDEVPGIFALMRPVDGAVESFATLAQRFDTYVLSTSPWENPSAWSDKLAWVKKHLGTHAYKRLILTHHKNLNIGDYLIDDRTTRGADQFVGEHIHFGSEGFPIGRPSWRTCLLKKARGSPAPKEKDGPSVEEKAVAYGRR
jgi:5'-nucleotidase